MILNIFSKDIKVVKIEGTVQFKQNSGESWKKLDVSTKLQEGSIIFSGFNSNAILEYNSIKVTIEPLTQIQVSKLFINDKNRISEIDLKYGKIRTDVEKIGNLKTDFKVRSANTTASVRGTSFSFGNDELFVERGLVLLENNRDFSNILVPVLELGAYNKGTNKLKNQKDKNNEDYIGNQTTMDDTTNIRDIGKSAKHLGELVITVRVKK